MWTHFMDMHSGGGLKESPYQHIFIEAPEKEAEVIFYNRFAHAPRRVSCTCCGDDYSIHEAETLAQATGFERGCRFALSPRGKSGEWTERGGGHYIEPDEGVPAGFTVSPSFSNRYQELEDFLKREDVLIIPAEEIGPGEEYGNVPEQGYVWQD